MDILFFIHGWLSFTLLTIPSWPIQYLRYGVYIPLCISLIWIICDGCPLTHIQTNLTTNHFTKELLNPIFPNITTEYTDHINTFLLVLITVVGCIRLHPDMIPFYKNTGMDHIEPMDII